MSTAEQWHQTIAAELRAERGRTKKSVSELVEETGLSRSAVLNYLNAKRDIPLKALANLSVALGMTPVELLRRAEAMLAE